MKLQELESTLDEIYWSSLVTGREGLVVLSLFSLVMYGRSCDLRSLRYYYVIDVRRLKV